MSKSKLLDQVRLEPLHRNYLWRTANRLPIANASEKPRDQHVVPNPVHGKITESMVCHVCLMA